VSAGPVKGDDKANPRFFATPAQFRAWLERHHDDRRELFVGFYKKGTGRASITWQESVDEALCFGWIDGVRPRGDEESYTIRFSPRQARSTWSARNIARVEALTAEGRMRPAGVRAFEARDPERSGAYTHEQAKITLDPVYEQRLRANPAAWEYFQARPPWYRRAATWWVMSAKRETTRERRLAALIEDSANGRTVGPLTRPGDRAR
jgi:uncharacterized protein YdeI (YjbR/CyaY-like superfamily)